MLFHGRMADFRKGHQENQKKEKKTLEFECSYWL